MEKMLEAANATKRVPVADILESGTDGAASSSGTTSVAEPKQPGARVSYYLLNIS